ncbi:unnamed protein product [Amoebophrya sp. A25]|nr:unnamed protein product [Amoebophrya sp. A25]|eukprot:GSA25T00019875001.1
MSAAEPVKPVDLDAADALVGKIGEESSDADGGTAATASGSGTVSVSQERRRLLEELRAKLKEQEGLLGELEEQLDMQGDDNAGERNIPESSGFPNAASASAAPVTAGTFAVTPELNEKLQKLQQEYAAALGTQENNAAQQIKYLEAMQHTYGLSQVGIEAQMQKLQKAVLDGMARLGLAGGNLHAGLDAVQSGLKAVNGAKIYDSTDGDTSKIRIVPIEWKGDADGANWDFPFLQVDSSTSSSSKVAAVLKTVQYVQIPKDSLSHLRPWRNYYRFAIDGSKGGRGWLHEMQRQASLLNDLGLFVAMCRHGFDDVSVSLRSDPTNMKIATHHWWSAVVKDEPAFQTLFGQRFLSEIQNSKKEIRIRSIGWCSKYFDGNSENPCPPGWSSDSRGEENVAGFSEKLHHMTSDEFGNPEAFRLQVECAAPRNDRPEIFGVFRRVFVEFWWRKEA